MHLQARCPIARNRVTILECMHIKVGQQLYLAFDSIVGRRGTLLWELVPTDRRQGPVLSEPGVVMSSPGGLVVSCACDDMAEN